MPTKKTSAAEPTTEKRDQIIRLLVTDAEKQELRLAAAHARIAVAVYAKDAALEKARKEETQRKKAEQRP